MTQIMLFTGLIGMTLLFSLLMSYPVMLLWNGCLVAAVEGIREVSWLQAWGITVLFALLFKSTASTQSKD